MFSRHVDSSLNPCIHILSHVKVYERTGYVWEQYDPNTGEGRRRCVHFMNLIPRAPVDGEAFSSHPFTGWTSLVTLSEDHAITDIIQ